MKSCSNIGGPPSKPKYSSVTDSELVPQGKGEKNPNREEIEPETACLQSVEALFRVTAYLLLMGQTNL